jgi:hypothetical protein
VKKLLCGVAGMYPGFVAGILIQVTEINIFVLINAEYIEKCISGRQCTICFLAFEGNYLKLSCCSGETIV